jgi:hypothetical protein
MERTMMVCPNGHVAFPREVHEDKMLSTYYNEPLPSATVTMQSDTCPVCNTTLLEEAYDDAQTPVKLKRQRKKASKKKTA